MRNRLSRLERATEGFFYISIPQRDGTTARFPSDAFLQAWVVSTRRLCGEDIPKHPLSIAAENSSDPEWSTNFVAIADTLGAHAEEEGE